MKRFATAALVLWAGAMVTGCASMYEGTKQPVMVTTEPTEAVCELERDGEVLGLIESTPGHLLVSKSKKDIIVTCDKPGYEPRIAMLKSRFENMSLWNYPMGFGVIGLGVDAGTGALHEYRPGVHLKLPPKPRGSLDARYSAHSPAVNGYSSATYTALPAGIPKPYEGVRISNFSKSDMAWFCTQSWKRLVSPEGRTEYNPCHVRDVFAR